MTLTTEQAEVVQRVKVRMVSARGSIARARRAYRCTNCDAMGHNARTCGRPAPEPPPPRPPLPPKRRRVDGHNHCSYCGELGHTLKRHQTSAASVRGAILAHEYGLTFREAAEREGVSHQAVQQAYRVRFGVDVPPSATARAARLGEMVRLARSGVTARAIADQFSYTVSSVNAILRRHGIQARNERAIPDDDIAAAAEVVRRGGTYGDAAAAIGYSVQRVADRLRAIGVFSTATGSGRMDGRIARAIERVQAGESVPDACRAEGCALTSVYSHFKRLRGST